MSKQEIKIRELNINDINKNLLDYYNRYQEVNKVWRIENNRKVIKDESFIEHWDYDKKQEIINELKETIINNGTVLGAFNEAKLIGFITLDGIFIGRNKEYIQLLQLQVSSEFRGKGIGKMLFQSCIERANKLGAKKLYISAHSSIESMAFYTRMGCVDTKWLYKAQVELEPYDCQLEYVL